jgi:hypothetical protein
MTLDINAVPDTYGFRYGSFTGSDGRTVSVSILPPKAHWSGDKVLSGYEPHSTDWIVYANGQEIFRVEQLEDVGPLLTDEPKDRP